MQRDRMRDARDDRRDAREAVQHVEAAPARKPRQQQLLGDLTARALALVGRQRDELDALAPAVARAGRRRRGAS